ncbi:MAG TPA: discoidin domain-containing protein, partial [Cytophagales bacterium]|nr:discoidin domain-containing protein [Cytophagales bacterium]
MEKFSLKLLALFIAMCLSLINKSFAQSTIPGKIEAEAYTAMSGIQTEATADAGGGLNVGWIDAGDWMDYSLAVPTAGNYKVNFRIASTIAAAKLQLKVGPSTTDVTLPNTGGYQTWATVSTTMALNAGNQTIRISALTNGFNFNWMQFEAASTTNIARDKVATSSSTEGAFLPSNVVDGNTNTRWASNYNNSEWVAIDLGQNYSINKVVLNWETASGKSFDIEVSSNNTSWTSIYHTDAGTGGVQSLNVTGQGRYIRMLGKTRNTVYGYSLWEFEVYGTPSTTANQDPVVNAGADKTITLPTNSTNLTAVASDPDGDAITYQWSKVSGPAATLSGATTANLSAAGLTQGTYVFRITVTDGKGGESSDDVVVTVNAANTSCAQILSTGKTASASSTIGGNTAAMAVDGNMGTRWESQFSDPQWITVDLGASQAICKVVLDWETASG